MKPSPHGRGKPKFSELAAPVNKPLPLWILYPLFFVGIYLSHATLLRLPYFWDEAGYYIPAALDFFHTGSLIPHSTLTNAHPPLPSVLLALWWRISGFVPWTTRVFICMISAAALLGVFRLARTLAGNAVAATVTILTALYPVWFAQSTLAHADIFAAAFTLWALSFYLEQYGQTCKPNYTAVAILFSLAALSKETAIITPVALALWELVLILTEGKQSNPAKPTTSPSWPWIAALLIPILPLAIWYAYHYHQTGFVFGNPEFLRYNASANMTPLRVLLSLWHRTVHLTLHMNMYVPVLCTAAVLLMPRRSEQDQPEDLPPTHKPLLTTLLIIILGNALAFSVLGGALLTRYLLPLYPLVLLVCVCLWKQRFKQWPWLAVLTAVAFFAAQHINPPYAFAPEDNLTYRDMIVLHQQAIHILETRFPAATVLTAWPATTELEHPELGYTHRPIKVTPIDNFSPEQIQKAAADPGTYDTALIFSTKWTPPPGAFNLSRRSQSTDTRFFDFHDDVSPAQAALMLHGEIIWQAHRNGEWAAVLHFPRVVEARLLQPASQSAH